MEHISIAVIRHFVEVHAIIVYFIIIFGVVVEGEIVVIFAGIFSYLGSINLFIAFASVLFGGAIKSFFGYVIGYYLQKHHSHKPFMNKIERRISYFLPRFNQRPFWSIFISRFFILGIGWFTLLYSGYKKISLKTFIKAESCSLAIWSIGIMALGHFFSFTALAISRDIRNVLLMILVFFIMFFVLEKVIAFVFEIFNIRQLGEEIE